MREIDFGSYRGVAQEPGSEIGLVEGYTQALEDGRKVSNLNARVTNLSDAYDRINDRIKQATGEVLDNPLNVGAGFSILQSMGTANPYGPAGEISRGPVDPVADWKRRIGELKVKHADKMAWDGIEDEPERSALTVMKDTRERSDLQGEQLGLTDKNKIPVLGNVPVLGSGLAFVANAFKAPGYTVGQLLGGLRAQMESPVDAFGNLAGFTAGGPAASLLKNAAINAGTNALVQMPLSALKQLDYQKAGLPYGWKVWLEEVEGAAATGAALDLGIRGPSRAILRRYGRDVAPGEFMSRNTERGGFLTDAIEKPDIPTPRPRTEIDPDLIKKAADGDIEATKKILKDTGALEDPEIRGALHQVEVGERLTQEQLDRLEAMGVARPDGMRMLANVLNGVEPVAMPGSVRPAAELFPAQGNALLSRHVETIRQALAPDIARAVETGLDVGMPQIIEAVKKLDAGRPPAEAFAGLTPRVIQEATLHGGRAHPVEMAAIMRGTPDIVDASMPIDMGNFRVARQIATLEDSAFAEAASGTIPPEVAAMVAERVRPEHQLSVIRDLQKARPESIPEAADIIDKVAPLPREERPPLNGGGTPLVDPSQMDAKLEGLRAEAGQAYADAVAPIERRKELEAKVESLKAEVTKLEQELRANNDKLASLMERPEAFAPESDIFIRPEELTRGKGQEDSPEYVAAIGTALRLAEKRAELRQIEADLATASRIAYPTADGEAMYRLAMRAIALKREHDIARVVIDALDFGRRLVPEGTKIEVVPDEQMVFRLASGEQAQLNASSDSLTGHIQLAMHAVDPVAKMGHEAVHTLVTKGHISPDEVKALAALAREAGTFTKDEDYRKAYASRENVDALIDEEAAASYIEARIRGDVKGPENTIINRLKQLFERIKQLLQGYGFQSREDIVSALLSGEMARREARAEWTRAAQVEGRAAMRDAAERGVELPDGTMINGVPLFAIRAFHGSPYDFDRFDISKIGTGEGAQAYGRGLYFAEAEGTAKSYRDALGGTIPRKFETEADALSAAGQGGRVQRFVTGGFGAINRKGEFVKQDPGRMYEVRINADPETFLDWDKPLSQQPEAVRRALEAANLVPWKTKNPLGIEYGNLTKESALALSSRGQRPIEPDFSATGGDLLNWEVGAGRPVAKQETSDRLRDAGIPGIKYKDQMSRGTDGGTSNYVVFDDSLIEITHKDGVPVQTQEKMFSLADRDTGQSMRRDLDALGYYSKALEAARELKQAKGTPEQMLAQLKKAGVKDAEIAATNLNQYLEGKSSVTRDEIISHLEGNRVGVREVAYYRGPPNERELANMRRNTGSADDILARELGIGDDPTASLDRTKWSSYSLDPSNPTYRETVLHLPPVYDDVSRQLAADAEKAKTFLRDQGIDPDIYQTATPEDFITMAVDEWGMPPPERYAVISRTSNTLTGSADTNFRSGHFPEPNIIGHMMTSMTRHEGKPVYTIDQIQSDWGQKLRDGGVRDEAKIAELTQARNDAHGRLDATFDKASDEAAKLKPSGQFEQIAFDQTTGISYPASSEGVMRPLLEAVKAADAEYRRLDAELRQSEGAAPGHPLVNTTDQWTTTTLRRAIRQAAEADADYIAIPHGDTVLSYNPGDEAGMRGFYGSRDSEGIVPKNLRKILEKIDKDAARPTKVTQLETPTDSRGYRPDPQGKFDKSQTGFTLFPLTDKVKAEVMDKGMPLFSLSDRPLDMSVEARKKRAEAMGFDTNTIWFHGTRERFSAFDPATVGDNFRADERGFFFINDPKQAGEYATSDGVGLPADGGSVIPSYLRMKNPLIVDDMRLRKEGMERIGVTEDVVSFWDNYQSLILEWADKQGADGVVLVDNSYKQKTKNKGQPTMLAVVFDAENIRSVNADFDPAKSASANLMASLPDTVDLKSDMAFVDRLSSFKDLIEACRA